MNKTQKKHLQIYKIILLKIKIPCDGYFSCGKVFCSKVKFTIVYYSKFSLGCKIELFKASLCYVDGETSGMKTGRSGVPQGTVLGPLCFLSFINDIGNSVFPGTIIRLFADDSLLYRTIHVQH